MPKPAINRWCTFEVCLGIEQSVVALRQAPTCEKRHQACMHIVWARCSLQSLGFPGNGGHGLVTLLSPFLAHCQVQAPNASIGRAC